MTRPTALKTALVQHPAEATVKRMWHNIESNEHAAAHRRVRYMGMALAATAMGIIVVSVLLLWPRDHAGVLQLVNHSNLSDSVFTPNAARFEFTDGSSINTRSNTRFDVVINRTEAIEFALREGTMAVQVTPGGPRRWIIHAGEVDVIVVGTIFDVTRTAGNVSVNVQRGKVCVKGNGVPDGIQMLTASMTLQIPAPTTVATRSNHAVTPPEKVEATPTSPQISENAETVMSQSPLPPSKGGSPPRRPAEKGSVIGDRVEPPTPPRHQGGNADLSLDRGALETSTHMAQEMSAESIAPLDDDFKTQTTAQKGGTAASRMSTLPVWKQHAKAGNFEAAYQTLPANTFSTLHTTQWSPDDLFLLSDIARISRHAEEACTALGELINRYPNNSRAGIAAYTLARVTTESLHHPKEGAVHYEQALSLGISKALKETALIRLIQHYRQTDPLKAKRYENIYLAEYPTGRYLEEIRNQ